jgi:hypothetical protein
MNRAYYRVLSTNYTQNLRTKKFEAKVNEKKQKLNLNKPIDQVTSQEACKVIQCDPSVHVFEEFCQQIPALPSNRFLDSVLAKQPQIIHTIRDVNKLFHHYLQPILPSMICALTIRICYGRQISLVLLNTYFNVTEVSVRKWYKWIIAHKMKVRDYWIEIPEVVVIPQINPKPLSSPSIPTWLFKPLIPKKIKIPYAPKRKGTYGPKIP